MALTGYIENLHRLYSSATVSTTLSDIEWLANFFCF